MRYNGFEREAICSKIHPSLGDLEKYSRFSEESPILKALDCGTVGKFAVYHKSRFVRQAAARETREEWMLNHLKKDENYFVRAEAFRNRHCQILLEDIDANFKNELCLAAIAERKELSEGLITYLIGTMNRVFPESFIVRFQLLRYQTLTEAQKRDLTEGYEHYGLQLAVVLNRESTEEDFKEVYAETSEEEVLIAIAERAASLELQKELSSLGKLEVSLALCRNPHLQLEVAAILAQSDDFEVREALASQPDSYYRRLVMDHIEDLAY